MLKSELSDLQQDISLKDTFQNLMKAKQSSEFWLQLDETLLPNVIGILTLFGSKFKYTEM